MCGITACVGPVTSPKVIHDGLRNLEYRGYDSVGVAFVNDALEVYKTEGEVDDLTFPISAKARAGIGHTRWSTHGPPTDANAHPHTDCTDQVAVAHNGIIENYEALKADLSATHIFKSETDTEVIPHLIEDELANGSSLVTAVRRVTDQLEGSYAFVVTAAGHDGIVGAREDSPLVVGHGETTNFIASDVTAFIEHTREVTYLENGDLAYVTEDDVQIYHEGELVERDRHRIEWDAEAAEKSGYDHYMLKEIHEQPQALRQTLSGRVDELSGSVDLDVDLPEPYLRSLDEIQIVAAGTSYHAGLYAAELIEAYANIRTTVKIASEYELRGGRDPWRTLVIAITQSGETADTLGAMRSAAASGARTLAVTNTVGSTVTRDAEDALYIRAGPEIGVAATKTFVTQVATMALLAIHLGRATGHLSSQTASDLIADLRSLPGAVQQVLDHDAAVLEAAREYVDSQAFFFIGRRAGYPVALESALKLKEISYGHAEGFAAGELKHGPLALVTADTPVIAILTDGAAPRRTLNNLQEAATRDAPVVGITTESNAVDSLDRVLQVPAIGVFEPVLANVVTQLFAYHVANLQGRPIDKPRNLAKSVTVQ